MIETSSPEPIVCKGLAKTYRDFWGRAVHPGLVGLDLVVRAGESHAILGPNGSGKTTALRILLGLLEPTAGEARLFGRPVSDPASRRGVGFLPEQTVLHGYLTCEETVALHAGLHGLSRSEGKERAAELLAAVDLTAAARRRARELSLGMRRRLGLAAALAGRPRLLVLDEPTAGMDPVVRERVAALLRNHVSAGGTLLVTSHLLGDLSGIARRATLLAAGKVVRTGDLGDLLARRGERTYRIAFPEGSGADAVAAADAALRDAAERAGGRVLSAAPSEGTLEDLFLETYRDGAPPAGA